METVSLALMRPILAARQGLMLRGIKPTILELRPEDMNKLGPCSWSSHAFGLAIRLGSTAPAVVGVRKHGLFECVPPEREFLVLPPDEPADSSERFAAVLQQMIEELEPTANLLRDRIADMEAYARQITVRDALDQRIKKVTEQLSVMQTRIDALRAGIEALRW